MEIIEFERDRKRRKSIPLNLLYLPRDILIYIFSFLIFRKITDQLFYLRRTCKTLLELLDTNELTRVYIQFPHHIKPGESARNPDPSIVVEYFKSLQANRPFYAIRVWDYMLEDFVAYLPQSLKKLVIDGLGFDRPSTILQFPEHLKILKMDRSVLSRGTDFSDRDFEALSRRLGNSLVELALHGPPINDIQLEYLPTTLTNLSMIFTHSSLKVELKLHSGLRKLRLGWEPFNEEVIQHIPPGVRTLTLPLLTHTNVHLLPRNLRSLRIEGTLRTPRTLFSGEIASFPIHLREIVIADRFNWVNLDHPDMQVSLKFIPASVTSMTFDFEDDFDLLITDIPYTLSEFKLLTYSSSENRSPFDDSANFTHLHVHDGWSQHILNFLPSSVQHLEFNQPTALTLDFSNICTTLTRVTISDWLIEEPSTIKLTTSIRRLDLLQVTNLQALQIIDDMTNSDEKTKISYIKCDNHPS